MRQKNMKYASIYGWLLMLACLFMTTGCTDDELMKWSHVSKNKVWVNLSFGSNADSKVNITTRGTYELQYESKVQNIYVFLFANNQRVYGHYFDSDDLGDSKNAVQSSDKEQWYVDNMSGNEDTTTGTVRMKVPIISGNAEIVMIANLDLDFLNLSEEKLNMVRTRQDLTNVVVGLNQDIVERNAGLFMMVGSQTGVSIANNGTITVPGDKVVLSRLDAKIEMNVKIDGSGTVGADGQPYVVKEFVPDSWQVINLPKYSYLEKNTTGDPERDNLGEGYFNLSARKFETYTDGKGDGFSFYMLENRETGNIANTTIDSNGKGNYHLRDKRTKNSDGTYSSTAENPWEYAPKYGTYVILKGTLNMEINPDATNSQHLTADVVYHIHLGDFSNGKTDNYDIERNTHYIYTITIKGVNSIETEVRTSNDNVAGFDEPQPGASGSLYKTSDDAYVFDAHYGQRVYTLQVEDINAAADASTLTWYVKTPFGREGSPSVDASGEPIYDGLDYKWVEFMLNEREYENGTTGPYTYSDNNQWYPGTTSEELMDVIEFTNLIKREAPNYREGVPNAVFDKNGDLKVTVFVNEFYYEVDPTNPDNNSVDLWKQFVNQPHRFMHILGNPAFSKDGESSMTSSSITIRQRSIATPYNIDKNDLKTAWGCETEDETNDSYWWFFPGESRTNDYVSSYTNNTSKLNGLYNTGILWGVAYGTAEWKTYMNFERKNDHELFWMNSDYKSLLYASMMRNRDNNGNGKIDKEEVRWYIASLEQLFGLFIGDMGLPSDAQLYRMDKMVPGKYGGNDAGFTNTEHPTGIYKFRDHVVSSTRFSDSNNYPVILWAEEGASTSRYRQDWDWKGSDPGTYSIRCVRNLGLTKEQHEAALTTDENDFPAKLITAIKSGSGADAVYEFDLTNVNGGSLRTFYTTETLLPSDEYNPLSRPYKAFVTGAWITTSGDYGELKTALEAFTFDPDSENSGYRVPNVREGALMRLFCDNTWWNNNNKKTMVSTYYSMGKYGGYPGIDPSSDSKYNWTFGYEFATVNDPVKTIRLVKDIEP